MVGKERLISGTHMVGTKKSLGQHWLKNREILNEIADLAREGGAQQGSNGVSAKLCVEIGPGLGFLTSSLLKRFDKVIAVEYDDRLAENLPKSFPGKNLEVVKGDILQYDFGALGEPRKRFARRSRVGRGLPPVEVLIGWTILLAKCGTLLLHLALPMASIC